jgi:hypothetical protein
MYEVGAVKHGQARVIGKSRIDKIIIMVYPANARVGVKTSEYWVVVMQLGRQPTGRGQEQETQKGNRCLLHTIKDTIGGVSMALSGLKAAKQLLFIKKKIFFIVYQ